MEDDGDVPSLPPEMQCTPFPSVQFRTPKLNRHHEEDVVGMQQSIAIENFTNWQSFGNHQVGEGAWQMEVRVGLGFFFKCLFFRIMSLLQSVWISWHVVYAVPHCIS